MRRATALLVLLVFVGSSQCHADDLLVAKSWLDFLTLSKQMNDQAALMLPANDQQIYDAMLTASNVQPNMVSAFAYLIFATNGINPAYYIGQANDLMLIVESDLVAQAAWLSEQGEDPPLP